ncbi:MAG: hypothetical protein WCW36_00560 [Candidatus Paceibacterota bacterium]|jgi:hypothetical protein
MDERSRITFTDEDELPRSAKESIPLLNRLVIRYSYGLINDVHHANYVLLVLVFIMSIIAFISYPRQDVGQLSPQENDILKSGRSTQSYDAALFQR